jgi:hypothetical protein
MVQGLVIVDYLGTGLKIVRKDPKSNIFCCDQQAAYEYIKFGGKLILTPECLSGMFIIDSEENRKILKRTTLAMKLMFKDYNCTYLRQLNKDGRYYTTTSILKARGIKINDFENIRRIMKKKLWADDCVIIPVIKEIK